METCLSIYVTFEGLGLCCFNSEGNTADIAFLRLKDHDLKIKIAGPPDIMGGRKDTFLINEVNSEIMLASSDTIVKGVRRNDEGNFERRRELSAPNDLFDLRWLVDFEGGELHDKKAKPRKSKESLSRNSDSVKGLTRMFLPNAYFFTEQILSTRYVLEEINDATNARRPKATGLFGSALGAKVDAVKAALIIKGSGGEEIFQFDEGVDPKSVTRFFVTITNICEPCADEDQPQSDFYKYYEVLDFEDGIKHDFHLEGKLSPFWPRPAMCEFTWLSKTQSLDDYF